MGKPSADYPYPYTNGYLVAVSIDSRSPIKDKEQLAFDLAKFLKELQAMTDAEGPEPSQHNWWRGYHVSF